MYVTILRFRVKPGMEEALHDHNEEWKATVRHKVEGFISVHVYKNPKDSRDWTHVATFVDQVAEMMSAENTEHRLWYKHMLEMIEGPPQVWHGELIQEA
jgi:quinol monooxygenase YgiN